MALVVDASVTLAWLIIGEATPYTNAIRSRLRSEQAFVPPIWPYEVANALLIAERRGRITQALVLQASSTLDYLAIIVDTDIVASALHEVLVLARHVNLTVYDASYLDLAMNRSLPIATIDNRMRAAAGQLGIEIVEPE